MRTRKRAGSGEGAVARPSGSTARRARAVVAAVSLALLLASCGAEVGLPEWPEPPAGTAPPESPAPGPGSPAAPELVPGGSAEDNLPYFDWVLAEFAAAATRQPSSRVAVNTLARAGFDKADMEVTADTSRVGNQADSLIVSVRLDDSCLIAQFHERDFVTQVAPVLASGTCLVGRTIAIDW